MNKFSLCKSVSIFKPEDKYTEPYQIQCYCRCSKHVLASSSVNTKPITASCSKL